MLATLAIVAISTSPMTTSSSRTDIRPPLALDEAVSLSVLDLLLGGRDRQGSEDIEGESTSDTCICKYAMQVVCFGAMRDIQRKETDRRLVPLLGTLTLKADKICPLC